MRAFLSSVAVIGAVCVAFPGQVSGQEVRGQVVDSVTGDPLAGGVVILLDVGETEIARTHTDAEGRFLLYGADIIRYRLRAEHEGHHSATFPEFEMQPDRTLSYVLLLPSLSVERAPVDPFHGKLAGVCGTNQPGVPTIAGWIRDGDGVPVREASVSVSWANLPDALALEASSIGDYTGVVLADSAGFYAICNAPIQTKISIHGMSAAGVSDFHDVTFGRDAVVAGGEAYFNNTWVWSQDLEIIPLDDLHTVLTGMVTDATTGEPIIGAEVELTGTVFADRTDSTGTFRIEQLPAGPAKLIVRQIGHRPLRQEIGLPPNGTLELPRGVLAVGQAPLMLDPLVVEATATRSVLTEFNRRRVRGTGAFLTMEEWERRGRPTSTIDLLRRLRGVRILPGPDLAHQYLVSMRRTTSRTFGLDINDDLSGLVERSALADADLLSKVGCPPLVFVDRQYRGTTNTLNLVHEVPFGDLIAVEAHQSTASMPIEFTRRGSTCGVLAFWTRYAQPETVAVTDDTSSLLKSTVFHFAASIAAVLAIFLGLGQSIHF